MKKLLSVILAAAMLFSLCCVAFAQDRPDYLLMGDSIAEGFGVLNPEEASYGAIVANTNGYNYHNVARTARATSGLLRQIKEDSAVRQLIADAEIISLSIGGNDYFTSSDVVAIALSLLAGIQTPVLRETTEQMYQNFDEIIRTIRGINPDVTILAQTVFSSWHGLVGVAYRRGTDTVNEMITSYLEKNPGVYEIVDVASVMNNHPELVARDTVHPNYKGNIVIAKAVLEKLKELGLGQNTEPALIADGIEFDYFTDEYGEFGGKIIGFLVRLLTGNADKIPEKPLF